MNARVNVTREMRRARSVNRTKKCTTVTVRSMTVAELATFDADMVAKVRAAR